MQDSGLTKEYLENALGFPIEKFVVKLGSNLGDGNTCAVFGVNVWKESDHRKPRAFVVKCYPENEARQQFIDTGHMFQVELSMYDEVIPALTKFQEILPNKERISLPFARMVFGQYVKPEDRAQLGRPFRPLDNSIVMPDLRKPENGPFLLRDRFLGFDLDHYRLVIEGHAKLHAIAWAYKCSRGLESLCSEFPYLKRNFGTIDHLKIIDTFGDVNIRASEELFQNRPDILEALDHFKAVHRSVARLYFDCNVEEGQTKDSVLRRPGQIVKNEGNDQNDGNVQFLSPKSLCMSMLQMIWRLLILLQFDSAQEPWATLLHGDCWSNNMMFRYDEKTGRPVEVVFIDLQISRESDPMADICYSLFTSVQPGLRRKHLTSMLHVYFDTFTQVCQKFGVPPFPGWNWEEFNRRFRRATIFGGYMASSLHIILKNPDELENWDDAMEKVEISGEGKSGAAQNMANLMTQMSKNKKIHPAVVTRLTAVFEDMIQDGIL